MGETDRRKEKEDAVEAALRQQTYVAPADRLERMFLDHHAQVFRTAYRITGNPSDAEDVLQTVFLRIVRLGRGRALSETPASYLHRAAINAALDLVRDRKASRSSSLEDVAPVVLEQPGGQEREQEGREIRDRVRRALAEFSPKMAEVFALRYFEGYDNHEIARMLRTSRSTVAVLLHRARGRLKKEIRTLSGETR